MIKNILGKKHLNGFYLFLLLFFGISKGFSQCPTVVNATQTFCNTQSPTIADLVATDNGNGVVWYATATSTTPLSSSAGLVDGEDYFADDNSGTCGSRQQVDVTIYSAPTGQNFQGVCVGDASQATIASLIANGNAIQWYNAPTGGVALATTTILNDNTIYYASQTNPITGCQTSRLSVFVNVGVVPVPTGNANQVFCNLPSNPPTVADLVASGVNNWYSTVSSAVPLDITTPLVDGQSYFATTLDPPCESITRLEVVATLSPPNNSGNNGNITICFDDIAVNPIRNLFNSLGGTPDNTGVWTGPLTTTNGNLGTIDMSTLTVAGSPYVFTYTVNNLVCAPSSSTVTITIINNVITTVASFGPYCQNATPGILQNTSTNGVTGTWSPATISTATVGTQTYTFTPTPGQCASIATINVTITAPIVPTFTALGPYCQNATPGLLPTTSDNGYTGTWSPATISTATVGTQLYTFTPTAGQCADITTMSVTITAQTIPTFTALGPYCQNATPGLLPTTSNNGYTGTWSPATISTATVGTQVYTFTPTAGQCASTTTMSVTITAPIVPTFTALGPYCQNDTPGLLPTTSNNGYTGTWSPATISTATVGTQIYTFTPTLGQCASIATINVTITAPIVPTFTALGPYCQNDTPDLLPTTSNNGYTGTWSPATISTVTVGTQVYTFTPTAGQCAAITTMSVTITAPIIPTFTALGPYCQNATPGLLPTTSNNGYTGTWSPATISTATVGTQVYTFTPTAGQCATTTTMSVTITAPIVPTFTALGPYCQNATPGLLLTTSNNGITGTWSPASISTATVGTQTYTFTPTLGQCATTITMDVTITTPTVPTFTALGPYCQNDTPGLLPTTSNNGYTGTWSPATISTATVGTQTYTFTPTLGQCATTTTMDVTITAPMVPTFTALGPYCQNDTPGLLPTTSNNGYTGTWTPTTISTATVGTQVYTFTPTAGQCAAITTLSITITAPIIPTFTVLGPYCQNATPGLLPTTSNNGYTGTWSPATISTATVGTQVYMFTPTAGQCAAITTMSITITAPIIPTFTALGPYCQNDTPGLLPTTSNNGYTGTWSPATISTATVGTQVYTFTPTAGQCADITTMSVTITAPTIPTFTVLGPYCQNATPGLLPTTSTNGGITGTWSPATISTTTVGTQTYTFTPTLGQCATTTTMDVTITAPTVPTFTALGPYCQNATPGLLPTTSNNGYTGTWSPATISTATVGTQTYTFTPTLGQCATITTMDIVITTPTIIPAFTQLGSYCQNTIPDALPTVSTNGAITGTWSPATISTSTVGTQTYTFTPTLGQCAATTTMDIVITTPSIIPTFTQLGSYCQNTIPDALPTISTNGGITGTWSPATISTTTVGTQTYTFTPTLGQCAATTTMDIVITTPSIIPTFTQLGSYCQNTIPDTLPTISTNGGITGTWSPATISTSTVGTQTYTFTPTLGQCAATTTMDIVITTPSIIPTFTQLGSYCQNTIPDALPTISTNGGITGTWSPATISTTTVGTQTYTFTPTLGQCAATTTMDIVITTPSIIPTFTQLGSYCQNTIPDTLPTISTNGGITGTWSPATISTTTVGTQTYTFTPTLGQCAATTTMDIVITAPTIVPTFTQLGSYCQNTIPDALPTVSTNGGITGTWSPATISTTTVGTQTYTFTPTLGQCAATTTMDIVITVPTIVPTFTQLGSYCQNTIPDALPTVSTNGAITGTWSPATISTTTVGTQTYTFTPTLGQCAATTTMDIVITAPTIVPTFTQLGSYCQNTIPDALPTVSTNGAITGTWLPATISTTTVGTQTYTFTPTLGQCAATTTMDIVITAPTIVPTFTQLGSYCQNTIPDALPTVSTNGGITGTWSPATISTTTIGTQTYTFTPTLGQCAATTTMDIVITAPTIVPTFTQLGSYCQNTIPDALPAVSTNGAITGTWSPATISTTTIGTQTYTFTPTLGQCAATTTMDIVITAPTIVPTFTQLGSYCQNATPDALPTVSTNGAITGTWSPATISTTTVGTQSYTFTPTLGQCAATTTMDIVITAPTIVPTFTQLGSYCQNTIPDALPTVSTNGAITGTWSPATISTTTVGTQTYTFTPTLGQCAIPTTMDVTVTAPVLPTFTALGPYCQNDTPGALLTTSIDGITGTWSPATISTATLGTQVYTFTPTAGLCATTTTMSVTINGVLPTFTALGPYCQNTTPGTLPTTSTDGYTGTWSPATISTATVGTQVYTFIPTAGQCAAITTMSVTITAPIVPIFTVLGPYCQNDTPGTLPTTSNDGYTGTWSPATILTTTVGTQVYTFTPTSGQCATTATMSITVSTPIVPAFTQLGPYCQNTIPDALPTISTNGGITGTWSPSTISTVTLGTQVYTFTPTAGQCAAPTIMNITVDISCLTIIIPDGFSPNGDGINDEFVVNNLSLLYPNYTIEVYNRYGSVLYKGNINTPNWNGKSTEGLTVGDGLLPTGVYFFIIEFNDGDRKPLQGRVYLSR